MTALVLLTKVALLWMAGFALTGALAKAAAASRDLVWRGVCGAVVLLPLLALALPTWSLPGGGAHPERARLVVPPGTFAPQLLAPVGDVGPAHSSPGAASLGARAAASASTPSRGTWPWSRVTLWVWMLGAAAVLWPWCAGRLALTRVLRGARPVAGGPWREELRALSARLAPGRRIELAFLERASVPMLWSGGLLGPAQLVLPRSAAGWKREQIRSVLLHELAHLVRGDGRARLVARVALALSWPVPFAWWGHRRMRLEAERACDDLALRAGTAPSSYAEHLLAVALEARGPRAWDAVAPAMARRSELDRRIAGVLEPGRRRLPPTRRAVASAATVGALSLLPLAAFGQDVGPDPGRSVAAEAPQEEALTRGLDWLLAAQDPRTGAWSGDIGFKLNHGYRVLGENAPHVGVTALALLALIEAGALPGDDPRGLALRRGGRFLVSALQTQPGYVQLGGTRMKSHGLALEALARLQAATQDEDLRAAVLQALEWTASTQNAQGGWRYLPYSQESDVLHTATMVRALEAVAAAGIELPERTLERARKHVADHRSPQLPGFRYQVKEVSRVSAAASAAGLEALRVGGRLPYEFRSMALDELPALLHAQEQALGERVGANALVWHARDRVARALEAWVVDAEDRARWESFRDDMRRQLRKTQLPDGSWPCDGGPGAAYATAIACRLLAD